MIKAECGVQNAEQGRTGDEEQGNDDGDESTRLSLSLLYHRHCGCRCLLEFEALL